MTQIKKVMKEKKKHDVSQGVVPEQLST